MSGPGPDPLAARAAAAAPILLGRILRRRRWLASLEATLGHRIAEFLRTARLRGLGPLAGDGSDPLVEAAETAAAEILERHLDRRRWLAADRDRIAGFLAAEHRAELARLAALAAARRARS
ncbi:hypothetical protein R5H32_15925 [Defluviimonas sp. D31]|uniref:hypothetical protein n=1 Tax=Defluviimonas sp. D31 TaxID=3083253 RepID=UPI00296E7DAA|nr:hypothetical protein [Defluviimonas sp. D31]MDW4550850.1 hypothetical protein [Defluviimonas sp. D31]